MRRKGRGEPPSPHATGSKHRLPGLGILWSSTRSCRLELIPRGSQRRLPEHPQVPREAAELVAREEEAPEEALDSRSTTLGFGGNGRSRPRWSGPRWLRGATRGVRGLHPSDGPLLEVAPGRLRWRLDGRGGSARCCWNDPPYALRASSACRTSFCTRSICLWAWYLGG